jgi:lysophospholipase L1-like esterase
MGYSQGSLWGLSVEMRIKMSWMGLGILTIGILTAAIALEIFLRWRFGFGSPLLYQADPAIGYLLSPNQKTRRFGNRIEINEYAMRSDAIAPQRSANTLRIFIIGDSIANGGWWTDQPDTISSLLQQKLQADLNPNERLNAYDRIEVLNASANSWGPRNELAYLQKFGTFEAQLIVLLINTDDLFAIAPNSVQVGRDHNYPDRPPVAAIAEVIQRYVFKQKPLPELVELQKEGGDRVGRNLAAIREMKAIATQHNAKFLVGMTPLLREIGSPGPRDYELKERAKLSAFMVTEQIEWIDFLPNFNALADAQIIYQDHIHFNRQGNQEIVSRLLQQLGD